MTSHTALSRQQHIEWLQDIEAWRHEHAEALSELKELLDAQNRIYEEHLAAITAHGAALDSDTAPSGDHLTEHVRHKKLQHRHRKLMTLLTDIRVLLTAEEY